MYIEICSCLNTVICILGYTKLRIYLLKNQEFSLMQIRQTSRSLIFIKRNPPKINSQYSVCIFIFLSLINTLSS